MHDRIPRTHGIALFTWLALGLLAVPPARAQAPAPTFTLEGNQLLLPSPIAFKPGTAELTPESEVALRHLQQYLEAKKYITLMRIEGHVSDPAPGQTLSGQELSNQRSLTVVRWLVAHGVDCKRLLPVGFGQTKPVAEASTAAGRAQNQRIAAVNATLRDRPIGGMPVDGGGQVVGDPCQH